MPPFCFFIQTQGHGDILNFPSLTPAIPALSLCLIVFHFNNALRIVSGSQGICIVLNPSKYLHCSLTPTLYQLYLSSATIKKDPFLGQIISCLSPNLFVLPQLLTKRSGKFSCWSGWISGFFFPYRVPLHALHPSITGLASPSVVFSHTHHCPSFQLVFVVPFYPSLSSVSWKSILIKHPQELRHTGNVNCPCAASWMLMDEMSYLPCIHNN